MPNNKQTPPESPIVPPAVVGRLSLYLREITHLLRSKKETTNSGELGRLLGLSDAQVRKDLAHFGHFGQPGVGYRCEELISAIRHILGTDRSWPVILVGVGNLGRALLGYKGFVSQGFDIVAAVDVTSEKIGTQVEGITIEHFERIEKIIADRGIHLAILAVPAPAAQKTAQRLVDAGIQGIMNFAPVTLSLKEDISLLGVDLAMQMEQISFSVANKMKPR